MQSILVKKRGHKCECCGLETWQEQPIPLEVHHINGDHIDNRIENLQLLCPNCHALTSNWRGKNSNSGKKDVTDEQLILQLKNSPSIYYALTQLGLSGGGNYKRAYKLIEENNIQFN